MKKQKLSLAAALVLLLVAQITPAQQAATQAKIPAKLPELLEASGYNYTKAKENVWTIPFKGKSLTQFSVFVAYSAGLVVVGAVPAEKRQLKVTPDLLHQLLKFNDDLDRVKVAIDSDGDISVRIDSSLRVLDAEEFKAVVEQVAAAADEVYAGIRPFLIAAR